MKRALPFLIIVLVLVITVVAAFYLKRSAEAPVTPVAPLQPSTSPGATNTPKPDPATVTETGADPAHALGPSDAKVTLEEFGDFECPPCGMLHPVLKDMEKQFGQRIRIIFREFPLVPTHVHALSAARSAEAAGLQGKFWEMHDLLYENQKTWHDVFDARPIFEDFATRLGLNLEKFRADAAGDVVAQRITRDGARGHALGVTGTPTVFMNGREIPFESLAPDKLKPIIQAELDK